MGYTATIDHIAKRDNRLFMSYYVPELHMTQIYEF